MTVMLKMMRWLNMNIKNLETEQSAINQMLQGLEQVRNDNIERTFSIFS